MGADAYEQYVGRWSRPVAREFLAWLGAPPGLTWLDVGCGTGALSEAILACRPRLLVSLDRSLPYAAAARVRLASSGSRLVVADGCQLPLRPAGFDQAMSGLVLNFVADPAQMVAEMRDAVHPGGRVAVYVWDYAGRMELMRHFWDAAVQLDPAAHELDEGVRFPLCRPEPLRELFLAAGLEEVAVRPIDVPTVFRDFDDYWQPFLGGQGPAPGYAASLAEDGLARLRQTVRGKLPVAADGTIALVGRAWGVKGSVRERDPAGGAHD